jgi:hypothetical protein
MFCMPQDSSAAIPCPSQDSIPVAASRAASIPPAASVASAAAATSRSDSPLLSVYDYPQSVQELCMNGFPLRDVVKAYDLVGDNFDDMLSLLATNAR